MSTDLISVKDRIMECQYRIEEFIILIPGQKPINYPLERVGNVSIEHAYEIGFFPIFKVDIVLTSNLYIDILKNKEKVEFKIRLQNRYIDINKPSNSPLFKDIINDKFKFYTDMQVERPDNNYLEDKKLNKKTTSEGPEDLSMVLDLYLFKGEQVEGTKKIVNYVLDKTDLTSVIVLLLKDAGFKKKVLMSPLENNKVYRNILLPPQNIIRQLKFLDSQYGLYKNGSMIYFDFKRAYILNNKPGCNAWEKDEFKDTNIIILNKKNSDHILNGMVEKKKEKSYNINVDSDSVFINEPDVVDKVLTGKDTIFIDDLSADKNKGLNIKSKAANIVSKNSNVFFESTINYIKKSNQLNIAITFNNIDMSAFEPNKNISLIFEDTKLNKKYKGSYKATMVKHIFTKNGLNFNIITNVLFKKVK